MKCLTTGILALSVTVTATVALAADYEVFAATMTEARGENYYAVDKEFWQLVVAVKATPAFLRALEQFEDHGECRSIGQASL